MVVPSRLAPRSITGSGQKRERPDGRIGSADLTGGLPTEAAGRKYEPMGQEIREELRNYALGAQATTETDEIIG